MIVPDNLAGARAALEKIDADRTAALAACPTPADRAATRKRFAALLFDAVNEFKRHGGQDVPAAWRQVL